MVVRMEVVEIFKFVFLIGLFLVENVFILEFRSFIIIFGLIVVLIYYIRIFFIVFI